MISNAQFAQDSCTGLSVEFFCQFSHPVRPNRQVHPLHTGKDLGADPGVLFKCLREEAAPARLTLHTLIVLQAAVCVGGQGVSHWHTLIILQAAAGKGGGSDYIHPHHMHTTCT